MAIRPKSIFENAFFKSASFFQLGKRSDEFAGNTTLPSGDVSVTVSTTLITNSSIVRYGTKPNSIGVGANSGGAIVVTSVVPATSFAFARATGVAVDWDEVVMWELVRTT